MAVVSIRREPIGLLLDLARLLRSVDAGLLMLRLHAGSRIGSKAPLERRQALMALMERAISTCDIRPEPTESEWQSDGPPPNQASNRGMR